jgi:hypothetical protein
MTPTHFTPTQDEFDALKITLAARDAEIKRLRNGLQTIYLGTANPRTYALKILTHKGANQ